MTKNKFKPSRIKLSTETIRELSQIQLGNVAGGYKPPTLVTCRCTLNKTC